MVKTIVMKTIENVSDIILEQEYDSKIDRYRSSYLYRGLSNVNYHLETSLRRNCKNMQNQLEMSILRNFTKYAAHNEGQLKESLWRQLAIGQHHGLPTRLLDWTYSPLIGLHFAMTSKDLSKMDESDSVLWKIDIREMNSLLPERYINRLNDESAYLFTIQMLNQLADNFAAYDMDMQNKAMVLLEPPSIDQRIINQYSYFMIVPAGINNIEEFLNKNTSNTVKYIIDKKLKWRIRDMLDQMNINERIVYPGLDGLSMWIQRHYYVK